MDWGQLPNLGERMASSSIAKNVHVSVSSRHSVFLRKSSIVVTSFAADLLMMVPVAFDNLRTMMQLWTNGGHHSGWDSCANRQASPTCTKY